MLELHGGLQPLDDGVTCRYGFDESGYRQHAAVRVKDTELRTGERMVIVTVELPRNARS